MPEWPANPGNWQATKAIFGGAPFPDSVSEGITLSIIGSEYSVLVAGNPDKGSCELDASSSPLRMTIRGTEGPNTGKTFLAICDFPNSEEMRVCYDMKGVSFPGEFTSTAENGYFLVNYRRKDSQPVFFNHHITGRIEDSATALAQRTRKLLNHKAICTRHALANGWLLS